MYYRERERERESGGGYDVIIFGLQFLVVFFNVLLLLIHYY